MEITPNNDALETAVRRWKQFNGANDTYRAGRVADEICVTLSSLIRFLTRTHLSRNRHLERAELENVARVGILDALDRYDSSKGATFATFVRKTVNGNLSHFVRDTGTGCIKEPGYLQENRHTVRVAERILLAEGRETTPEALIEQSGLSLHEINSVLNSEKTFSPVASLGGEIGEIGDNRHELGVEWVTNTDTRLVIESVLNRLPEELRVIIERRYFGQETLAQIAPSLGVSTETIRRREGRALGLLREYLKETI